MKGRGRRRQGRDEDLATARALRDQGIDGQSIFATAALLARYEKGRLAIDDRSVVIIDEVSQLGVRDAYRLLDMQAATGYRILAIGDMPDGPARPPGGRHGRRLHGFDGASGAALPKHENATRAGRFDRTRKTLKRAWSA